MFVEWKPAIFRSPLRLFGRGGRPEREKLILVCYGFASGPSFVPNRPFEPFGSLLWRPSASACPRSAAGGDFSSCVYLTPPRPSLFLICQSSSVPIRKLPIQDVGPTGHPAHQLIRQNRPSSLLSGLQRLC